MARDEGNGLFRRIFCCGRQGLWGKKVACPRLRIPPRLRGFASGSRDVLELQGQEDAASSQSNRGPTAGGHRPGSLSKDHPTDGMRPIGRSSSSTSTALKVKQRRTLSSSSSSSSSLRERRSGSGDGGGDADCGGEMDPGDLGVPPMINLIPPTPSNLMDDDRFFQTTSEEGRSAQSSCNKRAARPGSPKKRHAGSCRSSQGPQITTSSSTCCDHVGLVEGEASVISPDNPAKPSRHLLEEFLEVNSENVPLQLGFNPSWNLENNFDSEADSNASSHVDLVGNYPMAQQDTRKNDLNNKETVSKDLVKTNPQLKPLDTKPDSTLHIKRLAMRSCSLGDVKTNVGDLRSLGLSVDPGAEGGELPRQRRVTVASYVPSCLDQGENLKDKVETKEQRGKSLEEMNTLEVCEWFKNLGLQRSVPFIKEAKLQGHQLTAIDLDTLDLLQLADTEEKETLLSSIYKELHPTDTTGQSIDQLLETIGPYDVERFTAALAGLSPSQAPGPSERIDHPSRREDKHTEEKTIKKSNLVNLSMKAFERKLKLKVPSDSTAADVIEACWKILGLKDDVRLLTLNTVTDTTGKVLEELQADEQIGELKLLGRKELKLQLCKKPSDNLSGMDTEMGQVEEQVGNGSPSPELAQEPGVAATSPQGSPQSGHPKGAEAEENEANEWNQRTMIAGLRKRFFSLQQETAGLFAEGAFLTNPRPDPKGSEPKVRLIRHLGLAQQVLDNNSSSSTDKNLLELLKLDYLMLKERTQPLAAWNSLHEFQHGQTNSYWQSVTFSQLIAPHCTAVLVRVQLTARPDGYGFTVKWSADRGLQIETAENTGLQPNDRSASAVPDVYIKMIIDIKLTSHVRALEKLVEVNGVCVLSALEDELGSYLTTPTAHIVALRNPAPSKLGSLNWGETDDVPKPD